MRPYTVTTPLVVRSAVCPPYLLGWLGVLLFLSWQVPALAQTSKHRDSLLCATPDLTAPQRQALEKELMIAFRRKLASGQAFTGITYVPIRPHIFRQSNGKGSFDLMRLNNVMALTNSYYLQNGLGIQFYFAGSTPDYIDNDALYQSFEPFNETPIEGRDATRALNMYFVNAFSGNGLGGYAHFPEDAISSTRTFILSAYYETDKDLGNRLIPHELGHTFNLYHTFEGSTSSTPELVTRSAGANCTTTGDLVCDTPADPYYRSGVNLRYDANGCPAYDPNSTARDANGEAFSPSMTNIMSYYFPCTHDFTPGQYDRMQAGLALRQTHTTYSLDYAPTAVAAPTNVVALVGASKNVVITWQDNAANEMGYFIERATSSDGPFVPIGGVAPNSTRFVDTKAAVLTTYYYRIRPSNTTTGSLSSAVMVTTTTTPVCIPNTYYGCTYGDGLNTLMVNGETLSQQSGCSANNYTDSPPQP